MKNYWLYILILFASLSCKKQTKTTIVNVELNFNVDDTKYSVNKSFSKGDVRRYGVFPNKPINKKKLANVIKLADSGLPINFPKGHYKTNLNLTGITDVNLIFDDAIFDGFINIIESVNTTSKRIKFDGKLTILDKLFIRNSEDIIFDTVIVKTDTLHNISKHKNRGVSIYVGSKNISFNTLKINNTGGEPNDYFKHTAAALQVHGWNNNPENLTINYLNIKNSGRHAAYITGLNHKMDTVLIEKFGQGSNKNIFPLGDAKDDEVLSFSGLWINKCNACEFNNVTINTNNSIGKYSLNLDEGRSYNPTFINNLTLIESQNKLPILDDDLTNILVKKVNRK